MTPVERLIPIVHIFLRITVPHIPYCQNHQSQILLTLLPTKSKIHVELGACQVTVVELQIITVGLQNLIAYRKTTSPPNKLTHKQRSCQTEHKHKP